MMYAPIKIFHYTKPLEVVNVKRNALVALITFTYGYCKEERYANTRAVIGYTVLGSTMRNIPISSEVLDPGCHDVREAIVVPYMESGKYTLRQYRMYKPNSWRTSMFYAESSSFLVQ